mgnify:CR=1 FL=1
MFENLSKLYGHYGGIKAVLKSGYFWVAVFLSIISYKSIFDFGWTDLALGIMPSLTGFTIAAFAIILAILDPNMLKALLVSDEDGRSPITSIAAAIGHAVFIQVMAMVLAISHKVINLNDCIVFVVKKLECHGYSSSDFLSLVNWIKNIGSTTGLFCTYYGVLLVLAAILSIVRMQLIIADNTKPKPLDAPKSPSA